MSLADYPRWLQIAFFVVSIGTAVVIGAGASNPAPTTSVSEPPDQEYNVTCYKWIDNGTARVRCPESVYAPNSVVNITVKHCDEYEFAVDEPHPCYG